MNANVSVGWVGLVFAATACNGSMLDAEPGQLGGSSPLGPTGDEMVQPDAPPDPGRPTLRRLNRAEYNNTVRDLFGTDLRPADDFPDDGANHGFDTVGESLSTSPLQLELFEIAARRLVGELFLRPATDPKRTAILSCDPNSGLECVTSIVTNFGAKAFRRPLTTEESTPLVTLYQGLMTGGHSAEEALSITLQSMLMAPQFMFKLEFDPDPVSTEPHPLDSHELATRLSYFLWSSMPDEQLFNAAQTGALTSPEATEIEVARMLDDEKMAALTANFAGQWLFTRGIGIYQPDLATFPDFDEELRESMAEETQRFFSEFLTSPAALPVREMLTADFSFIDGRLARHYNVASTGESFSRVSLAGSARQGLLTQASILLMTSLPTRTSPVNRGKWVLEQLMCAPPPPPPPNVEVNIDAQGTATTLRDQLALHRADPGCAACHALMDPIGLGFENYDGIGAYRSEDNGIPIDATGQLPDGTTFSGAFDLSAILSNDARFTRCFSQQLMTYAIGRGFELQADDVWLDSVTQDALARGGRVRDYIASVALSRPFRERRGELEAL